MKKILKLINDERKLVSIKGQKACDIYATNDVCSLIDNNGYNFDCRGATAQDICHVKDNQGCYAGAYDECNIDNTMCGGTGVRDVTY